MEEEGGGNAAELTSSAILADVDHDTVVEKMRVARRKVKNVPTKDRSKQEQTSAASKHRDAIERLLLSHSQCDATTAKYLKSFMIKGNFDTVCEENCCRAHPSRCKW